MCSQEAYADVCIYVHCAPACGMCVCMCKCVYDLEVHVSEYMYTHVHVCMYVCKCVSWKQMSMCACAFTCMSYSVCTSLPHSSKPVWGIVYVCVHTHTWLTSGQECVPV